jgi:hypothetical protein
MPTETTTNGVRTPESLSRENLIDAARDGWTSRLIDLSRRNNLLFYKPVLSGTLELSVTPKMMEFLTDGESLPIRDLLASEQDHISNVRAIARKGLENLEEKGLSTLYLALGKCTWAAGDGGRDPAAAVLLIPIVLKIKGQDIQATEIQVAGETEVNPVLLHIFHKELNVSVEAEELLNLFSPQHDSDVNEDQDNLNFNAVLDRLNTVASNVPGFRAEPFAVVGNFSFQKLAMVKDLENRRTELLANDVVAAIAGDNAARRKLGTSQIETDPSCLDAILPEREFAVVEADSSQQCAIAGISAGQSAVVHGPPGTGKSQTITNLIATLAANGQKVLFVAEKRAALEVVMNRLEKAGLDHLAIDLHGAEQTPKKVMERVARTLTTIREAGEPVTESVHEQFVDRRNKLNRHDARMHTVHAPTAQTVYAMQGTLLRLPSNMNSTLRWRGPDLMQITPKASDRVLDLLGEAAGFETLFNRSDPSPWTGVELKDGRTVQEAVDLAARLTYEHLPQLTEYLHRVVASSQLRFPKTLGEVHDLLLLLDQAEQVLTSYKPDVFNDAANLLNAMSPGQSGGLKALWYRLTNGAYKAAYKQSIALRNGSKVSGSIAVKELTEAEQVHFFGSVGLRLGRQRRSFQREPLVTQFTRPLW